jgi:hypothetical protein
VQAMAAYRGARIATSKVVSVAFVGYGKSVVDGSDAGMLDVGLRHRCACAHRQFPAGVARAEGGSRSGSAQRSPALRAGRVGGHIMATPWPHSPLPPGRGRSVAAPQS